MSKRKLPLGSCRTILYAISDLNTTNLEKQLSFGGVLNFVKKSDKLGNQFLVGLDMERQFWADELILERSD